ncbi:MAG: hypothetical protein AAF762_00215 [Pseudomonadota bacterium]
MPRNAQGVYSKPPNTAAVTGQTITSQQFNSTIDDIAADLNAARPISSGGTGAADVVGALNNLGLSVSGSTTSQLFESRAAATAATINAGISFIILGGYAAPGDGGFAGYKRVVSEPSHSGKFQDASGAWWELAFQDLCPRMFGTTDDDAAWAAMKTVLEDPNWGNAVGTPIGEVPGIAIVGRGYTQTLTQNLQLNCAGRMEGVKLDLNACTLTLGDLATGTRNYAWALRDSYFNYAGASNYSGDMVVCERGFGWTMDKTMFRATGANGEARRGFYGGKPQGDGAAQGGTDGKFWGYSISNSCRFIGGLWTPCQIGGTDDHTGSSITGCTFDQGGMANLVLCNPINLPVHGNNIENASGGIGLAILSETNGSNDVATGVSIIGNYFFDRTPAAWEENSGQITIGYNIPAMGLTSTASARHITIRNNNLISTMHHFSVKARMVGLLDIDNNAFRAAMALNYDAETSAFTENRTLTGGTSGATAGIVGVVDNGSTGFLTLADVVGTFQNNETITDDAGGSATVNEPSGIPATPRVLRMEGTASNVHLGRMNRSIGGPISPNHVAVGTTNRVLVSRQESTFDPVLRGDGTAGTLTYSARYARWWIDTGIARLIGRLDWSAVSVSPSGNMEIPLPIEISPLFGEPVHVSITAQNVASSVPIAGTIGGGGDVIRLWRSGSTRVLGTDIAGVGFIYFDASFPVDFSD